MNRNIMLLIRKMILFILCLSMVTGSIGCSNEKKESGKEKNYIYYINKNTTKLVPKEYELKATDEEGQLEELLRELSRNTDDVDVMKAIPDKVEVMEYSIQYGLLTLSFNQQYESQEKAREVLTRAAIVLTLTQLEHVESVSFTINGIPLMKGAGEPVGRMEASDFADNLDSNKMVYNTDSFTIYFANQQKDSLVKYEFETKYGSNMSKEQVVMKKLIEGPAEEEGYLRTIPANVEVVNVVTMDNICYVTFGENFLTEPTTVADNFVIYSIVNSLSEISYIHKVQIQVSGKTDAVYHGTISLAEPFTRNLDFVENTEG